MRGLTSVWYLPFCTWLPSESCVYPRNSAVLWECVNSIFDSLFQHLVCPFNPKPCVLLFLFNGCSIFLQLWVCYGSVFVKFSLIISVFFGGHFSGYFSLFHGVSFPHTPVIDPVWAVFSDSRRWCLRYRLSGFLPSETTLHLSFYILTPLPPGIRTSLLK